MSRAYTTGKSRIEENIFACIGASGISDSTKTSASENHQNWPKKVLKLKDEREKGFKKHESYHNLW